MEAIQLLECAADLRYIPLELLDHKSFRTTEI